jgi:hypothetical protein
MLDVAGTPLAPSTIGHVFMAPAGGMVYFSDYVLAGEAMVFRRDIDAARPPQPFAGLRNAHGAKTPKRKK